MDDFAAKPTTIPFLAGRLRHWLPHLTWPEEAGDLSGEERDEREPGGPIDAAVLDELTSGDASVAASGVRRAGGAAA
jgi:hypothetical protein